MQHILFHIICNKCLFDKHACKKHQTHERTFPYMKKILKILTLSKSMMTMTTYVDKHWTWGTSKEKEKKKKIMLPFFSKRSNARLNFFLTPFDKLLKENQWHLFVLLSNANALKRIICLLTWNVHISLMVVQQIPLFLWFTQVGRIKSI